jgi:hypothetical protein
MVRPLKSYVFFIIFILKIKNKIFENKIFTIKAIVLDTHYKFLFDLHENYEMIIYLLNG